MKWAAALGVTLALVGEPAAAWGDRGHEIIAGIAQSQLTPQARRQVERLLAGDDTGLVDKAMPEQATWADKWRDSDRNTTRVRYEQTRQWHYVNIRIAHLDAPADLVRACHGRPPLPTGTSASAGPARACIVDKIDQFTAELRHPDTPTAQRRLALQFLLHFIGDVHQPLHASDDNDRGGNDKKILLPGFNPDNLHQFWDNEVVRRLGRQPDQVARELARGITPQQRRAWSRGDAADWALDSFAVARQHTYARLPEADAQGRRKLTPAYVAGATQVAKQQLRKAGVRLAWVLNGALR